MTDDKRKFIRFTVFLGLKFKLSKGVNHFLGVTRNFSRKGFCFVSNNFNFPSKEILHCDIKVPGENTFFPVLARTVWTKQFNGDYLVGAELMEEDKEPIWKILDHAHQRWCDARGYITRKRENL